MLPNDQTRLDTLLALTGTPTATGKEDRVVAFIESWTKDRAPRFALDRDAHGNLLLRPASLDTATTPSVLLTAHLDHPAFVVERLTGDGLAQGQLELSFRGGVRQEYFDNRPSLTIHTTRGPVVARIISAAAASETTGHRACIVSCDHPDAVRVGDVGVWTLPDAWIDGENIVNAPACDDLAALAAALCALDEAPPDAPFGVLMTRAEETGFVGAIGACRDGFIPTNAKLLALENSRSFAHDSPIGAGPIVRVGDRMSTFSPTLTAAVAKVCESLTKEHAERERPFRWQRKLMPGGACEATCYCAYGYDATCVCLPLGNYHNMGDLDLVEKGEANKAMIAPERIATDDYLNLVDMLVACATGLEASEPIRDRLEKMFEQRRGVLSA
jgi:endoglucanase